MIVSPAYEEKTPRNCGAESRVELHPGVDYTAQDAALVSEIRPRLLERYRALSDADLLTASIVFVGRK
jgi:hypothetical protein